MADEFDYVTERCALTHLQKPACNIERDILEVDEVSVAQKGWIDQAGKQREARTVIYQFRNRPLNGPVSAEVLRDTEYLFKDDKGQWQAGCEVRKP